MSAPAVISLANFGDLRGRNVFSQDAIHSKKATAANAPVQIDNMYHGIKSDDTAFEVAKISAVQPGTGTASSVAVRVNAGTGNTLDTIDVANLSSADSHFKSTALTADFLNNYTVQMSKGLAEDGTTDATRIELNGGGGTKTSLVGGNNSLFMKAGAVVNSGTLTSRGAVRADTSATVGADLTIEGNNLHWFQKDGANTKLALTKDRYVYNHAGLTGYRTFELDGAAVDGTTPLNAGGYKFVNYKVDAGTVGTETVLALEGGNSAGNQTATFTSHVGIYEAGSATHALAVTGDTRLTGNVAVTSDLSVAGNLTVSGSVTTVNSTELVVEDMNITLASGATTLADINGAGITLGTGDAANKVHWQYNNTTAAWEANTNTNLVATKSYLIDGGAATGITGATFSAAGPAFGSPDAALKIGPVGTEDLILNKSSLTFTDSNAVINFGTDVQISSQGFSSTAAAFKLYLGQNREWAIFAESVEGQDVLSIGHDDAGTQTTYVSKFSVFQ